jgi:hypothetical protein
MRNDRAEFLISNALFESEDEVRFRRILFLCGIQQVCLQGSILY